jgi:hypothetical protein
MSWLPPHFALPRHSGGERDWVRGKITESCETNQKGS